METWEKEESIKVLHYVTQEWSLLVSITQHNRCLLPIDQIDLWFLTLFLEFMIIDELVITSIAIMDNQWKYQGMLSFLEMCN